MVYRFPYGAPHRALSIRSLQDAVSLRRSCHFRPTHIVARTFPADARSPAASPIGVALWLSANKDHIVSFATQFSLTFLPARLRGVQYPFLPATR